MQFSAFNPLSPRQVLFKIAFVAFARMQIIPAVSGTWECCTFLTIGAAAAAVAFTKGHPVLCGKSILLIQSKHVSIFVSFNYALLSCTLRYYTSLHFQESALYHSPLVIMCISGSFFCSTPGSADKDFLRLCPIYIVISYKTNIHPRIFAFLEVYDNHQQYYITAVQSTNMKRERLRKKNRSKGNKNSTQGGGKELQNYGQCDGFRKWMASKTF